MMVFYENIPGWRIESTQAIAGTITSLLMIFFWSAGRPVEYFKGGLMNFEYGTEH